MPREFTVDDYRALAEFRYQIRRFLHFSEQAARNARINPQQHQLLLAVRGIPANTQPTVREIAERLQIRHHTAVELTNRMSARRLIRKRRDSVDRRRVVLEITAGGEAVLRKLSLIHWTQLESAGSELIRTLEKLLKNNEGLHDDKRSRQDNLKRTR